MKIKYIITVTALAASTAAKPHHLHRRAHSNDLVKRAVTFVPAATQTIVVYWLDGHVISEEEAHQGVANGTLMWGDDQLLSTARFTALPTPPPASKQPVQTAEPTAKPKPKPQPKPQSEPEPKPESKTEEPPPKPTPSQEPRPEKPHPQEPAPPAPKPSSSPLSSPNQDAPPKQQPDTSSNPWAGMVDKDGHCAECDKVFPNGKIRCTEFPYGYGALPTKSQGLGGWSGIQDPQYVGADGFDNIRTVVKDSCSDGTCCTPGSFCSYGCPNPYLKASFPSTQGRTGQSVGGLYCNNDGYLEMADGKIADTLCVQGSTKMSVKVQNKLLKSVSFCRTDYPGTESMTFPVTVGPGETGFLANPDQQKYFFWQGKKTSAQYYVNKQGVPEDEACTWGTPMGGKGNWAPAVFGTSFNDGPLQQGFSSLKQNELCKKERLGYDITFEGEGVVSPCKYKSATNQWCEDDKCWEDPDRGCTAAILHGNLTVVLSEG